MKRLFLIAFLLVATVAGAGDFINFPNFPTRGQGPFDKGGVWWQDSSLTFYAPFDNPADPLRLIKGTGTLSFTRATTATYTSIDNGFISTAASGQLRIESNGALIEGQRTNILLRSRTLNNAAWVATNVTVDNTITGEDGVANSASWVAASADNGTICQSVTIASAAFSGVASLKRITGTGTVMISLDNGATYGSDVSPSLSASAWYRASKANQTLANPEVCLKLGTSGDNVAVDYAQVEAGVFISSRIPTTTAAVTRNADGLSITPAGNVSNSTGTVSITYDTPSVVAQGAILDIADDVDGSERIYLRSATDNNNYTILVTGSATLASISFAYTPGATNKIAFAWNTNDARGAFNGSLGTPDTSLTTPEDFTTIRIGATYQGSLQPYGHIKNLRIWNRAFTDSELQAITTP